MAPGRGAVRLAVIAIAVSRAVGPEALKRALPMFASVGIAASVVFSPNGMRAAELVASMRTSAWVRLAVWAGWLLVSAPAARVLLAHPAALFLRSLPAPRWHFALIHGVHLVVLELPLALLYLRGDGVASAGAAAMAAAAAHALAVARLERPADHGAAAALACALLAGVGPLALTPVGLGAGAIGVLAAWERAPLGRSRSRRARASGRVRSAIAGPRPIALAVAYLTLLRRGEAPALQRSAFAAFAGAAVLALAAHNNATTGGEELGELAAAVGALPLAIATGGLAGPVLASERGLGWLLDVTATGARTRALAATLATSAAGVAAGLVFALSGLALLAALDGDGAPSLGAASRVAGVGAGWGGALGALAAAWARRVELASGQGGTALAASMIVTALGALLLTLVLGGWALLPLGLAALVLSLSARPRVAVAGEDVA